MPALTRRGLLAATGGALGTALVGCGNGSGSGGSGGTASEISIWVSSPEEQRTWFDTNIIAPFTDQRGVKVNVRRVGFEAQELRNSLAVGEGPDIIIMNSSAEMPLFQEPGFLAPLDDYAGQFGWADKIIPWALATGRIGDTLYALPNGTATFGIYYNRNTFQENGWSPPTSLAELEALAEDAQSHGIVPFMDGNADFQGSLGWFTGAFANHYAGPDAVFEVLTGARRWTDPLFVEAFELLNDCFQRGWFGGSVERFFTNTDDATYTAIADGTGAMKLIGTWASLFIGEYFDDWDWAPIPSLRPEVRFPLYVVAGGKMVGINVDSEGPDTVAEFIDHWFSSREAVVQAWVDQVDDLLPLQYEPDDLPEDLDERLQRQIIVVNEATEQGNFGYANFTFFPPKTNLYIREEFEKVMVGDLTVPDFLGGADELMQEELEEGAVPPLIPRG